MVVPKALVVYKKTYVKNIKKPFVTLLYNLWKTFVFFLNKWLGKT